MIKQTHKQKKSLKKHTQNNVKDYFGFWVLCDSFLKTFVSLYLLLIVVVEIAQKLMLYQIFQPGIAKNFIEYK